MWLDDGLPSPGEGWFHLITVEEQGGSEGTLGLGTCAERSNFEACP
jgi:hypothetical protein